MLTADCFRIIKGRVDGKGGVGEGKVWEGGK